MSRASVVFALAFTSLCFAGVFVVWVVPPMLDRSLNRVIERPSYQPSARAQALYESLFVADLHADSLLWDRRLARRNAHGHVDLPRLLAGGVALQAFTIVTSVPVGLNIERNEDSWDLITALALAQRWPRATWNGLTARALHQADKLSRLAEASQEKLVLIRSAQDLAAFVSRRKLRSDVTAAIIGVEGAHALDGRLANIDVLFEAGIRMMAPTHFFDTPFGGSAHGMVKGGLTELGRDMIARMEELGMTLDLAHASPALIDDALAVSTRPVVVSHTGVRGTCDNTRNLSDRHIRAIAASGGVIGIGYWETAVCGTDGHAVARAIRYAADLAGADHVGLGSDFDGAVATPFDTTGLPEVVDGLLAAGFTPEQVAKIMGGNVLRVLAANLPEAPR